MILTEEHDAFRLAVRQVLEREIIPFVDAWERDRSFPAREVFPRLGEAGLLGLERPASLGGAGRDHWYTVVLCEELGRIGSDGIANSIAIQTDMATSSLAKFGSDELKRRYLMPALRGEMVAAVGVTEPDHGSDVAGLTTTAVRDGDMWVISGLKKYITNGAAAHWVCTLARTSDEGGARGLTQIIVPTDSAGFSVVRKLDKLGGRAVDTAELRYDECRVPIAHAIGRGFQQQMASFDVERMVATYIAVGEMETALQRTRAHLDDRVVFGRPLIESQHIQFTMCALSAELELLRSYTYRFAEALAGGEDTRRIAAVAKLTAARLTRRVADTCLQFHGGTGYMDDLWSARYFRDSRLLSIGGGSDEVILRILARLDGMPTAF